jgi:putative transcriptional regulator
MDASLAPGLVVASPPLNDPNFDRTVVLIAKHGPKGALGFVVNRALPLSLEAVLKIAGYPEDQRGAKSDVVLAGGPVEPGSGWVLIRGTDALLPDAISIRDNLCVSSSRAAFDRVASGQSLDSVVILGYSGWGPGQLEAEIASGAWLPVPLDDAILFEVALDDRWEHAHVVNGIAPFAGLGMRTVFSA